MLVRSARRSITAFLLAAIASVASAHWVDPVRRNVTNDLTHGQTAFPFDFNGDGRLDIIASYSLSDSVYLLINPGDNVTPWTRIQVVANFVATRAVPFDGNCDGTIDIAAAEMFNRDSGLESNGRIAWYLRPSPLSGTWTEEVIESSVIHPYHIVAGDIDGDGDTDLAAITNSSTVANSVFWYENRCGAPSGPRWQRFVVATGANFASPGSVQLARIDGDTSLDIIVADRGNGRVVWFENGGTPRRDNWPMRTMRADIAGPDAARPHDLDADGDVDVIVAFRNAARVAWLEHPADPTGTWPVHDVSLSFVDPRDVAIADLNADARLDVIALSGDAAFGGTDTLAVFENNGDGSYTRRLADGNYYSGSYVIAGDIDADGDSDLATGAYNGNSIDWWENVHEPAGGSLPTPQNVTATLTSSSSVTLTWTGSSDQYLIFRNSTQIGTTSQTTFNDTVSTNSAFLYRVQASNAAGTTFSSLSAPGYVTTFGYTDNPIAAVSTIVKAQHLNELRSAILALFTAAGATPPTLTTVAAGNTVQVAHVQDLRNAINQFRTSQTLVTTSFTDSTLTAGSTPIRKPHMSELRVAVRGFCATSNCQ